MLESFAHEWYLPRHESFVKSPPALEQDSLWDSKAQSKGVASLTLPDEAK